MHRESVLFQFVRSVDIGFSSCSSSFGYPVQDDCTTSFRDQEDVGYDRERKKRGEEEVTDQGVSFLSDFSPALLPLTNLNHSTKNQLNPKDPL